MKPRVAITGIGVVSPFGVGRDVFWDHISRGVSGTRAITDFDASSLPCRVSAAVPDEALAAADVLHANGHGDGARANERPRRSAPLREGLAHRRARGARGVPRRGPRAGQHGRRRDRRQRRRRHRRRRAPVRRVLRGAFHRVSPYAIPVSIVGIVSSEISIALGLRGISHVLSTGCTSSTDAIGYAAALIRQGEADVLLTGGADACATPGMIFGFCRMRVTSTQLQRPAVRGVAARSIAAATGSCSARARG